MNNEELYHFGVKGMKWGVRRFQNKDGSYTNAGKKRRANENYSDKQRKHDRTFYGKGGERRINKKMNEGHGVQSARHYEVERKERNEKRKAAVKRVAKKGAKKASRVLATIGVYGLYDEIFFGGAVGVPSAKP